MNRKTLSRIAVPVAVPAALAVVGFIVYLMVTHQFYGYFIMFRDVAAVAYMLFARIGVPVILVVGLGAWLERKLHPEMEQEEHPLSQRLTWLKRVKMPRLSAGKILAMTFVAALWSAGIGITIARFFFGISYVSNMNDTYPWGIWLGFDVFCGVALAAGGFVLAGIVHVFNIKRFHPIVRPAILTAFLGYLLVIVGLLFDLGRWYQITNATFMWNLHSPLIEVAWCVMSYTTVLALEFSPVVFERFNWKVPLKVIRTIQIPLIIIGMCLSTLHQSTLGTLNLIFPEKINPLWYSGMLPVFFFISAVAVGMGMVIVEANLSARAFKRKLEDDLIADLGKAASVVLLLYFVLKVYDLVQRGAAIYLVQPGLHSMLYWIEMMFGVVIPMVVLSSKKMRANPRTVFVSGWLIVGGVVLNRLNTVILGWWNYTSGGPIYVPTVQEVTITAMLISIGVVAFGLIAKYFPIFEKESHAGAPAE